MPRFEDTYGEQLRQRFPCSVLSGIPVFRPDLGDRALGYEIDHLIHVRDGDLDTLFIIECKGCPVRGENGNRPLAQQPWLVDYWNPHTRETRAKDARKQVINHAIALIHFFSGFKRAGRPLKIEACVVSNYSDTTYVPDPVNPQLGLHLSSAEYFLQAISNRKVLRVEQSALLSQLRLGLRDENVGHPPISDAIPFIARSRNALDLNLYKEFAPAKNHWAINGTAGMGKSGVLAYALFVLATDREVALDETDLAAFSRRLDSFEERAAELALPPLMERVIHAVALKQKQVDVLRSFWERYRREFSALNDASELRFNEPVFRRWNGTIAPDCNVLLIDEAHDLDLVSQQRVAEWLKDSDIDRPHYLAIACDRLQKLRIVGRKAQLIQGVNFSSHTRRLNRNYRNPFPVFCAGLSIMFRWFALNGPKILPKREEMEDGFGLEVRQYSNKVGENVSLQLRNDSHPANHWFFTATLHESSADAYAQLAETHLGSQEVLWVRFSPEDSLFDYEQLSGFTYHNCCTEEAMDLVDKYVKGQEYPVVVIEGVPAAMNRWEERAIPPKEATDADENEMWRARRILYLCASRATGFLIFVAGETQGLAQSLRNEIQALVKQLGRPETSGASGSEWALSFPVTHPLRPMDVFDEEPVQTLPEIATTQSTVAFYSPSDLTVANLAKRLGLDVESVLVDLRELLDQRTQTLDSGQALSRSSVLPIELAEEFAQQRDCRITIFKPVAIQGQAAILTAPPGQGTSEPTAERTLTLPNRPTIRELARLLECQPSEVVPDVTNVNDRVENAYVIDLLAKRGIRVRFEDTPINISVETTNRRPASDQVGPATVHFDARTSIAQHPAAHGLLNLTREPRFRNSTAIERYLAFLQLLLHDEPAAEQQMLRYRTSRSRVHFAATADEIVASGNSTMPQHIPKSRLFAISNLPNELKRSIANDLLTSLRYPLDVRRAVCDWIMGR
jgi:negative regulator of replication initiation